MALCSSFSVPSVFTLILSSLLLFPNFTVSELALSSDEQESVYNVLQSINPDVPWRSLYPDDLCYSPPHGVVCDYFVEQQQEEEDNAAAVETLHVTELSFGFVSDNTPNPPCTPNSAIDPLISTFKHLRKLFFYRCFLHTAVSMPDFSSFGASLEELVFIENPSLVGSLDGVFSNLTGLRRFVLTGTNVSGEIPAEFSDMANLEQVTISRNRLIGGEISVNWDKLRKLKVLDVSDNGFQGTVPESIGGLLELLKLDLSSNRFSGKIPESLGKLKGLEFLDLSYNRFANCGIPLFLSEMPKLKEVYLSGNLLGGHIPEIWKNLGGVVAIGLSNTGLTGEIPGSMGVYLKNLCFLGLDNNNLEGTVPDGFGSLEFMGEMNLENNNLRGQIPFSANFAVGLGQKLKLSGNPQLCVDEGLRSAGVSGSLGNLKLCKKVATTSFPNPVIFHGGSPTLHFSHVVLRMMLFWGVLFVFC